MFFPAQCPWINWAPAVGMNKCADGAWWPGPGAWLDLRGSHADMIGVDGKSWELIQGINDKKWDTIENTN